MAMHAIGILPLLHQLQSSGNKPWQVWFAADATASGQVLHEWWVNLRELGPSFGYLARLGSL